MDFSQPVAFENAEIGQCPDLAPPPAPPEIPEEEEEEEAPPKPALPHKEADRPQPPASTVRPNKGIVGRDCCVIAVVKVHIRTLLSEGLYSAGDG